ncbi:7706_t:CDS:1, partial [Acaulospora colombiana]
ALEVLHIQMDFCDLYQRPQFCRDLSTSLPNLSTLSLTMAAQNSRGILDGTIHLPRLRALFLTFTAFGLAESTLSLWDLPSLCFVSLFLPIGSRNVRPVKTVPGFVVKFLQRYGGQIEGLRIFPGQWTNTERQLTIPMNEVEEAELWSSLVALRLFSTDFTRFPLDTLPSSTIDFFARIQHLWQKGKSAPNDYLDGVTAVVNICPNLQTLRFDREGERVLGPTWSPLHSQNSRKLRKICEDRQITLLGPPEETILGKMGSGYKKELRARKESPGETRYIVNYLYGS